MRHHAVPTLGRLLSQGGISDPLLPLWPRGRAATAEYSAKRISNKRTREQASDRPTARPTARPTTVRTGDTLLLVARAAASAPCIYA